MDGQGLRSQEARAGCGRTHEKTIVHGDGGRGDKKSTGQEPVCSESRGGWQRQGRRESH